MFGINKLIPVSANHVAVCKYKSQLPPDEGSYAYSETSANQNARICISRDSNVKQEKTVGVFTEFELNKPFKLPAYKMNSSLKKLNKLLTKYPDIVSSSENSSEIEVVNSNLEARTTGAVEAKTNTIISIPSKFPGEIYPPVYTANIIMSVIPRDCKVVKKQDCLPELFSLKLVEAKCKADKQLEAIRALLVLKDPNFAEKVGAKDGYLGQYVDDFRVRRGAFGWTSDQQSV